VRPLVVAVGANGQLYIWAKSYVENWSAFAPDFHELEENEEYVEREDEFDLVKRDPDDPAAAKAKALCAPEVVAAGAATEAAALVVEPARHCYCSPRHIVPFHSRKNGSKHVG